MLFVSDYVQNVEGRFESRLRGDKHWWRGIEGSTALADFPYWSQGKLKRHRMGAEKDGVPRGSLPVIISEFAGAARQEAMFIELLLGEEHGDDRNESAAFSDQLRRDTPVRYTVSFFVETWRRANVDFFANACMKASGDYHS